MRGRHDPSLPIIYVTAGVPLAVHQAMKAIAHSQRTTIARVASSLLQEAVARLGIDLREDLDKGSPEAIDKVEPVQGPPTSVHSTRLDPLRFIRS